MEWMIRVQIPNRIHLIHSTTRTVLLFRDYAIKVPTWIYYRGFLQGLLANMQEVEFAKTGHEKLCPVSFYIRGGLLLVMPRCELINRDEYFALDMDIWRDDGELVIPVEDKMDSLAWYRGKIVAIDYGT